MNLYAFRRQALSLVRLSISPQAGQMHGRTRPYRTLVFKIKQEDLFLTCSRNVPHGGNGWHLVEHLSAGRILSPSRADVGLPRVYLVTERKER